MTTDDVQPVHRPHWPYSQFEVNTTNFKYGRTFEIENFDGLFHDLIPRHYCCLEDGQGGDIQQNPVSTIIRLNSTSLMIAFTYRMT